MKKFYLFLVAMMATVCASAADLYVVGTVNSWTVADENYKMTANMTGTAWTFDFGSTEMVGQSFKINDGSWSGSVNLGASDKLDNGTTIDLTSGGNNIEFASGYKSITNVKITLKKSGDSYTLTATGTFTKGEAAIPDLYLRGECNGWGTTDKFTRDGENYKWSLTKTIDDPANFGTFKIADSSWGSYNIGGDGSTGVTVGTAYTLVKGSNPGNLWLVSGAAAGEFTFTLTKDDEVWSLLVSSGTTGIQSVNADANLNANGKFVENGRLVVVKNGKKFNMAGQVIK